MIFLDQPGVGKAEVAVVPYYYMIQHFDLQYVACENQILRYLPVVITRLRITGRMVVYEDQRCSIVFDRALNDLTRVDGAGVEGPFEKVLDPDNVILRIQNMTLKTSFFRSRIEWYR